MSERFPIPRSHPGRQTNRWIRPLRRLNDARAEVVAFTEHNSKWQPMLSLYERLCDECGDSLYGSAIMGGGIVLATRPEVEHDEGVITVYFDPAHTSFRIDYRHRDVHPDQSEVCPMAQAWERLRLFIGYKFGIRLSQQEKQGEQAS